MKQLKLLNGLINLIRHLNFQLVFFFGGFAFAAVAAWLNTNASRWFEKQNIIFNTKSLIFRSFNTKNTFRCCKCGAVRPCETALAARAGVTGRTSFSVIYQKRIFNMALFDTLAVTTELVQAGIERNQAESIAKSIAKVQGDTVTKDYLDLRLSEAVANLRLELQAIRADIQFTKWTNKAIMVALGVIASALIKIAFFH